MLSSTRSHCRSLPEKHAKAITSQRLAMDKKLVDAAREKAPRGAVGIHRTASRNSLADLVIATFPKVRLRDLGVRRSWPASNRSSPNNGSVISSSQGFNPIHRLMLEGPPGTGQTMTASVLAHELSLPLLTIRLDSVLSKFLGETSSKLRILFDAVAQQRGVYLFDDIRRVGRGSCWGTTWARRGRILNSFSVFLDQASPESIVVASTNHRGLLGSSIVPSFRSGHQL